MFILFFAQCWVIAHKDYKMLFTSIWSILTYMITNLLTSKFLLDLAMEEEVCGNEEGADSCSHRANTPRMQIN
jgi:hypothetical protein